jgi:hypothetical protein
MSILTIVLLVIYAIGVLVTGYQLISELFEQLEVDKRSKSRGEGHRVVRVSTLFKVTVIPFIPVANLILVWEFIEESIPAFFDKPLIK